MRAIWAGLLASSLAVPALAAGEGCIQISNDLDRLACYDKALGRTPVREALPVSKGKWAATTETSKLTDQTNVYLRVKSDEPVSCSWARGEKVSLYVRCVENKTALIFSTGCHMTSSEYNDYGDVTYRLDDEPAKTVGMDESTNNRSLGRWGGGRSIPVIKQMFGKSTMIVRMTPYGENPFTSTFDIAGLEEAIKPLREACHW